ncbi:MAG: hypothetical protein PUD36_08150 [Bacteroidales bacterium]|nr:hypothetical protein [Bacteroidales bacterium]
MRERPSRDNPSNSHRFIPQHHSPLDASEHKSRRKVPFSIIKSARDRGTTLNSTP